MDATPAQDSPRHILNILNDDCIEAILRRLEKLEDLSSAAGTCVRFQECAKQCFRPKYKRIDINFLQSNLITSASSFVYDMIPLNRVSTFLSVFGDLIDDIRWESTHNRNLNDEIFQHIAKFCGKTLKKLMIINYHRASFNSQARFQNLEKLTLKNAAPICFDLETPIKYLNINWARSIKRRPWFIRHFPHLTYWDSWVDKLTNAMLSEFLSLNPQLQVLRLRSSRLTPSILKDIVTHAKDLENLSISCYNFRDFPSDVIDENLVYLSELRKLWSFRMDGYVSLEPLINMFVKNNIPIWSLGVDMTSSITRSNPLRLRTLKRLCLGWKDRISEQFIIDLVKEQTSLESITISDKGSITMWGIWKILEYGKNLTELRFYTSNAPSIDLEQYNRILALAKNRVKVRFDF